MSNHYATRLSKADLQAINARVQSETADLEPPTIESLRSQGYEDNTRLNGALDFISGSGRVLTLATAEFIQAFAALVLMIVFGLLEAERIRTGSIALGQEPEKATLLAIAFTAANVIMPIYRLRNVRGQTHLERTRWTLRGALEAVYGRLFLKPSVQTHHVNHNTTLAIMESSVTWATLFLATYAVLGQQLANYADLVWYQAIFALVGQSSIVDVLQLVAGLLIAVGGVFGVQTIAHEIGVRTLVDQPQRLTDTLAEKQREYQATLEAIRHRVTEEHQQGKIADAQRRQQQKAMVSTSVPLSMNGTGKD